MFSVGKEYVMKSAVSGICWKTLEMDGEKSCIGGLHIFSDKSKISLSGCSLVFYPLHVTYINFMEDVRRSHISSAKTVAAYIPDHPEDTKPFEMKNAHPGNERFSELKY